MGIVNSVFPSVCSPLLSFILLHIGSCYLIVYVALCADSYSFNSIDNWVRKEQFDISTWLVELITWLVFWVASMVCSVTRKYLLLFLAVWHFFTVLALGLFLLAKMFLSSLFSPLVVELQFSLGYFFHSFSMLFRTKDRCIIPDGCICCRFEVVLSFENVVL